MEYRYMIAKTYDGAEYMHSRSECYFVSNNAKQAICNKLNEIKWKLENGQKWHIYECKYGDDFYCDKVMKTRNGGIKWAWL